MIVPEKLKSRKLWVTVATFILYGANSAFGLNLGPDVLDQLAIVVSAYLVGQSAVDYGQARERAQKYEAWANNSKQGDV